MQRVKRELNTPSPFKLGMSYCTALAVIIFFIFQHCISGLENKLITFESTLKQDVREQIAAHSSRPHVNTVEKGDFNKMKEQVDNIYWILLDLKK